METDKAAGRDGDTSEARRMWKCVRVIARLNVGGPARHVILLDQGLRTRGYRTVLVHGDVDSGEASLEPLAGERKVPTVKIGGFGRRISPIDDARALVRLTTLLFRESPDVVHTHTAKAGALGRMAALAFNLTRRRARRAVVVHTFHGHVMRGYFNPAINAMIRFGEPALGLVTDRVVAISPSQRAELVERLGVTRESKIAVVPLGLDLDPFLRLAKGARTYREELSISRNDVVVGYVGRMVPIKDLSTLVAAFAKALSVYPNLRLVLAGDGPARNDIERTARQAGIANRAHYLGWTEELERVYATFDLLALSSLNEGTPVAIIEAMAAGVPAVSTAVGGVPDVIEHDVTGLLVPARDVDALAAAIVRLAQRPEERQRLGAAARRRVGQLYGRERLIEEIDRLYRSALQEKRGVRDHSR